MLNQNTPTQLCGHRGHSSLFNRAVNSVLYFVIQSNLKNKTFRWVTHMFKEFLIQPSQVTLSSRNTEMLLVTKSYSTLWHQELQWSRLHCPLLSHWVCTNSYPLSQWCNPSILSYVTTSPLAFNLSQHQRIFQLIGFPHQVAKILELQLQHQSFQRIFRVDFL